MPDLLTCQGGLQINTASVTGGAGNESLSVDLPNGPKPGTIWVVDYAGFLFQDDSTLDDFTNQASGIYMVPIGTPTPDSLDSFAGGVNIAARGLPLIPPPGSSFAIGFGWTNGTFGQLSVPGPFIVPAGYTLRAVISCDTGNPIVGPIQLTLFAQLRILNQQST